MLNNNSRKRKKSNRVLTLIISSLLWGQTLVTGAGVAVAQNREENQQFSYSELLTRIDAGEVERIQIDPETNVARVFLAGGEEDNPEIVYLFNDNRELISLIRDKDIDFAVQSSGASASAVISSVQLALLLFLIIGLFVL